MTTTDGRRRHLLEAFPKAQAHSAYWIWQGMCGNGRRTGTVPTPLRRQQTRKVRAPARIECRGVVVGKAIAPTEISAPRRASRSHPRTVVSAWASGVCAEISPFLESPDIVP